MSCQCGSSYGDCRASMNDSIDPFCLEMSTLDVGYYLHIWLASSRTNITSSWKRVIFHTLYNLLQVPIDVCILNVVDHNRNSHHAYNIMFSQKDWFSTIPTTAQTYTRRMGRCVSSVNGRMEARSTNARNMSWSIHLDEKLESDQWRPPPCKRLSYMTNIFLEYRREKCYMYPNIQYRQTNVPYEKHIGIIDSECMIVCVPVLPRTESQQSVLAP